MKGWWVVVGIIGLIIGAVGGGLWLFWQFIKAYFEHM